MRGEEAERRWARWRREELARTRGKKTRTRRDEEVLLVEEGCSPGRILRETEGLGREQAQVV